MSDPISSVRIVRTIRDGKTPIAWVVDFTDRRWSEKSVRLTIDRDELPFPDRPTLRGITIACLQRELVDVGLFDPYEQLRPKPIKDDGGPRVRSDNELADLPADRVADSSMASFTANEQELVTIRPATPALSPNAPFPSKESRKWGETSEPHRSLDGDLIGDNRVKSDQTTTTDRRKRAPLGLTFESSSSLSRRATPLRLGSREVVTERTIYSSDDGTIIEQGVRGHTVVISWRVELDGATETVLISELLHPGDARFMQNILWVARVKRGDTTPVWAESYHRAKAEGVYFWVFRAAHDEALAILSYEWKAKRLARKRTGLTVRRVARLDQTLFGYSTVAGFAECAAEVSSEIPELGWSSETCCERLWKLLHEEDYRQPSWYSPIVLNRAWELVAARHPPKKVAQTRIRRSSRTSVSEAQPTPSLKFDLNRIDQIEVNAAQLSAFLGEVLRDEDESSSLKQDVVLKQDVAESSPATSEVPQGKRFFESAGLGAKPITDAQFVGLAARFVPFVEQISTQPEWTRAELDRIARELELMLDGAVDAVNEWADERFGDLLLIDEGDGFLIQGELLIDNSGPT